MLSGIGVLISKDATFGRKIIYAVFVLTAITCAAILTYNTAQYNQAINDKNIVRAATVPKNRLSIDVTQKVLQELPPLDTNHYLHKILNDESKEIAVVAYTETTANMIKGEIEQKINDKINQIQSENRILYTYTAIIVISLLVLYGLSYYFINKQKKPNEQVGKEKPKTPFKKRR